MVPTTGTGLGNGTGTGTGTTPHIKIPNREEAGAGVTKARRALLSCVKDWPCRCAAWVIQQLSL